MYGSSALCARTLALRLHKAKHLVPTTGRCNPSYCAGGRRLLHRGSVAVVGALQAGIVGLPNVGKSTLFNALVENGKAQAANFPFCTIEPNIGIVSVPDPRLGVLTEICKSRSTVATAVEFVDIAGLVKGASKGEGLGNQFLANIRETDAICQVVRCFEDNDVVHVAGQVNPLDDIDVINLELALSDISQIEKRLDRLKKGKKSAAEAEAAAVEEGALSKVVKAIEDGRGARNAGLSASEYQSIKALCLLSAKPMVYVANVAEEELANSAADNPHVQALRARAAQEGSEVVVVSAKVEAELNGMPQEEQREWLELLGVQDGGMTNLITAAYRTLGLRTYFTAGEKEVRAWTIQAGMTAPQAAGTIHTDFEKGFIRAETVGYNDFVRHRGFGGAKEAGALRLEGKEYVVQEGDVMLFRFNV